MPTMPIVLGPILTDDQMFKYTFTYAVDKELVTFEYSQGLLVRADKIVMNWGLPVGLVDRAPRGIRREWSYWIGRLNNLLPDVKLDLLNKLAATRIIRPTEDDLTEALGEDMFYMLQMGGDEISKDIDLYKKLFETKKKIIKVWGESILDLWMESRIDYQMES